MDENINKNKNLKAIIGIIAISLIIVGGIIFFVNKKNNPQLVYSNNSKLSAKEVSGVKEYKGNFPEFELTITGSIMSNITNVNLAKMSVLVYEFDAGIDNGWETVTNHYVGIKLKELLDASHITEFNELTFEATNYASITYFKEDITDDIYLVFTKDGKNINSDKNVMLLATDRDYNYSLKDVSNIYVPSKNIYVQDEISDKD